MRITPVFILVLWITIYVPPVFAQSQIYRCVDPEGRVLYSNVPCPSVQQETPEASKADRALLDEVLKALATGNVDRVVSFYRSFEELRKASDVTETRKLLRLYFTLILDRLGKPVGFEPAEAQTAISIEPSLDKLWDRADCAFGNYVFKTSFFDGKISRPGYVFIKLCFDRKAAKSWVRFVNIGIGTAAQTLDPTFEEVMTRYMKELLSTCQRLRLDSCG